MTFGHEMFGEICYKMSRNVCRPLLIICHEILKDSCDNPS